MNSNFMCAGFETLASILDRFMKSEFYDNHFTREDIENFFSGTCNKFLHSYGQNFAGRKSYKNFSSGEAALLRKCRSFNFFNKSDFVIDSGGYQSSVGILDRRELDILFSLYYEFLKDHHDAYDRAFILDVPPGPGCKLFNNFNEIYDLNLKSYQTAQLLPEPIRDKIIYIHHFRTPKLWDIYTKIMVDNDMFGSFKFHATGGIVANMSSDMEIPCIIYVIPMIPLINQALKHKRDTLHFHVLGGANFRDILFYELFKIHVMNKHKLNLEITYDSSGLFKGLMVGRFIPVVHDGMVKKVDIKTSSLDMRFKDDMKIIDIYRKCISDMSDKFGLKRITMDEVYSPKTGTFYEELRVYSLLYMLKAYADVQDKMRDEVPDLYKLYDSGESALFNSKAEEITRNLNGGKISKKQKVKTYSISRSLDMLTSLDENYCKYIVSKYLSKDEFSYESRENLI